MLCNKKRDEKNELDLLPPLSLSLEGRDDTTQTIRKTFTSPRPRAAAQPKQTQRRRERGHGRDTAQHHHSLSLSLLPGLDKILFGLRVGLPLPSCACSLPSSPASPAPLSLSCRGDTRTRARGTACSDGCLAGHARGPLTSLADETCAWSKASQDDEAAAAAAAGDLRWSAGRRRRRGVCRMRR
jgi:hypothetical protein